MLLWLAEIVDMAVATYLDEHVLGGYHFLMQNYVQGGARSLSFCEQASDPAIFLLDKIVVRLTWSSQ